MDIKKLQFRICRIFYSFEVFNYCPILVIFGSVFRIVIAFYDMWKIVKHGKFSESKSWYYDRSIYSESIVATCFSHLIVIIGLNVALISGILRVEENLFSYPWVIVEFVEIILQMVKIVYERSCSMQFYGLIWKVNNWLLTSCLVLGKTCVTRDVMI